MSFLTGSSPTTTIDYQDPLRPPGYGFAGGLFGQLPGLWGQQFPSYQGMWNPSLNPSLQMSSSMAQGRSISPAPQILGQAQGALGGFMTPWGLSSAQNRLSELGSPSYQNPMMRSQQGYPDWFGGGGWGGGGMGGMGGGSWLFPYFGGMGQTGGFMGGGAPGAGVVGSGDVSGGASQSAGGLWNDKFYGPDPTTQAERRDMRQFFRVNDPAMFQQWKSMMDTGAAGGMSYNDLYGAYKPPWLQFQDQMNSGNPWSSYGYYDPTGVYGQSAGGQGGGSPSPTPRGQRPTGTYDPSANRPDQWNQIQNPASMDYIGGGSGWWQKNYGDGQGGVDLGRFFQDYSINPSTLGSEYKGSGKAADLLMLNKLRKAAKSGAF